MARKQRNVKESFVGLFKGKNLVGTLFTLALCVSFFIPTPYYLYQPGSAEELAPRVTVDHGQKDEKGNLMLTTVLTIKASNIYYLAYGYLAPHTQIMKDEDVKQGMSDAEYDRLLQHMMKTSQENAVIAGLRAAGDKVDLTFSGVFVSMVMPTSKAKGVLEVGDVITGVDGHPLKKAEELTDYLNHNKKQGDSVEIDFDRDGAHKKATVPLIDLDPSNQTTPGVPKKVGLGVMPETEFKMDAARKVTIKADDIGGPSAGLMFSLEVYSQLTPGDLTKGYQIAGTGTIDQDGKVGQIGGIEHKIVAADKKGAQYFFAPADVDPRDSNYKDAVAAAKQIGTKMKIVPVKTMQDALNFLKSLPPKQ